MPGAPSSSFDHPGLIVEYADLHCPRLRAEAAGEQKNSRQNKSSSHVFLLLASVPLVDQVGAEALAGIDAHEQPQSSRPGNPVTVGDLLVFGIYEAQPYPSTEIHHQGRFALLPATAKRGDRHVCRPRIDITRPTALRDRQTSRNAGDPQ